MSIRNIRPGASLVLTGLLGVVFFWLTDHRYGWASQLAGSPSSIDQANEALTGTMVGVVGSAIMLVLGLWLLTRRTAVKD